MTSSDKRLLRFVLRSVEGKGYPEVEKLVYSTYPIATGERYSTRPGSVGARVGA